jgi:hypothetical protein
MSYGRPGPAACSAAGRFVPAGGQAGTGEDLADVVQRDDHLIAPVQGRAFLPVQQDAPVLLGGDHPAGELDLAVLLTEQDLDGGVESQGEGGEFRGGE